MRVLTYAEGMMIVVLLFSLFMHTFGKQEGKVSIGKYLNLIKDHRELMYWKEEQIDMITHVLVLLSAGATHWKEGQLATLRLIYTRLDQEREYDYDHWALAKHRLDEIFELQSKRLRNFTEFYISFAKNNHWSVKLPEAFNVSPKAKSFSVAAYNNSSQEALRAAIQYRDDRLNEWLAPQCNTEGI